MNALNFKFDLSCKVAIYVPSTTDANKATDNKNQVKKVMTLFSEYFGGCTASEALGGWTSPKYGLIVENVVIVYAYTDTKTLKKRFTDVVNLCKAIKNEMKQENVTLEVNNQIAFI